MKLSVLIPSVPARRAMALALYDSIAQQSEGLPVEILLLLDNKQRSIGKKREALVRLAQGRFLTFVDDDDMVLNGYVPKLVESIRLDPDVDVITFDSLCQINDAEPVEVWHSCAFENEEYNPRGFKRKPWHIHAWRRDFVAPYSFPDISYGEDWGWCKQFVPLVRREGSIQGDDPLYLYRYNSAVSEAA